MTAVCYKNKWGVQPFSDIMSDTEKPPDEGGGPGSQPGQRPPPSSPSQVRPGQSFAGAAQAASIVPGGRTWNQILTEAKNKRNILELHLTKIPQKDDNNQIYQPKHLTHDDLSDFLFKTLKIKHTDLLFIDYTTSWYGHREVELRPEVDTSRFLTGNTPIEYMKHQILVKQQETNSNTKVLFRNVPLNVPDEEILNLCMSYGEPVGWVGRERLTNSKDKGVPGSNRSVEVKLNEGASFENYYWLEGPLPGDQGRRIVVTHQGQPQQCSHCFSYDIPKYGKPLVDRCPAKGNGKACKMMDTPRARMGQYMKELERLIGYTSLKIKHSKKSDQRDIVEVKLDEDEDDEVSLRIRYKTPIVEKDEEIKALQEEKKKLEQEIPTLLEKVTKTTKQLEAERAAQKIKNNKFHLAMKITEQQICESIKNDYSLINRHPQIISVLALFQNRDNFIVDHENQLVKPIQETFFLEEITKDIEGIASQQDTSLPRDLYKERLGDVKNKLLEGLKVRWVKQDRRGSTASMLSGRSKRDRDEDVENQSSSRLRVNSPDK